MLTFIENFFWYFHSFRILWIWYGGLVKTFWCRKTCVRKFLSLLCPIVFSPFEWPLTHHSFFNYRLLFVKIFFRKVIGGHYSGETGTVVKVNEGVSGANKQEAIIILDQTSEEIEVRLNCSKIFFIIPFTVYFSILYY